MRSPWSSAWFSVLLVHSCAAPAHVARVWPGSYLVVLERENADALVIEPNGGRVNDRFATEPEPQAVAISRAGQYAVVCNFGDGTTPGHTLTVYDLVGKRREGLIDIAPHTRPNGVVFTDQRSTVLVTCETSGDVLEIAVRGRKVVRTIPTGGSEPRGIALSPDRQRAYTANTGSGSIGVLDVEAGALVATVPTGGRPEAIGVAPSGEIWVADSARSQVIVVDPATLALVETVADLPGPVRVEVTRNGRMVVVFCAHSDEVALIDARTRKVVARVPLELDERAGLDRVHALHPEAARAPGSGVSGRPRPVGLVIEPDSKYAFVSDSARERVVVIDLDERRVRGSYPTGPGPDGLAWTRQRLLPGFLGEDGF